jgi:hypothetical protein
MKKIWVYLLGVLTGIVITIGAINVFGSIGSKGGVGTNKGKGMSFFERPGDIVESSSVKVFKVIGNGKALAYSQGDGDGGNSDAGYNGPKVLLFNKDCIPYYDDQIIKSSFRQVGIFRYTDDFGDSKTVPIVVRLDR